MNLHRPICFSRCFLIGDSVAVYDKGNDTILLHKPVLTDKHYLEVGMHSLCTQKQSMSYIPDVLR